MTTALGSNVGKISGFPHIFSVCSISNLFKSWLTCRARSGLILCKWFPRILNKASPRTSGLSFLVQHYSSRHDVQKNIRLSDMVLFNSKRQGTSYLDSDLRSTDTSSSQQRATISSMLICRGSTSTRLGSDGDPFSTSASWALCEHANR